MSRQLFLFCTGCHSGRMPLPVPSPEKTSTDPPPLPKGAWSANVLHLECGHLSVYTEQDIRGQSSSRTTGLTRGGRERPAAVHEWRRVRLSCVEPRCTVQTIVFVYLSSPSTAQKVASTIFEQPRVWRCPAGHPVIYGRAEQEEAHSLWDPAA
jgi:hypothetical protein